MPPKMRELRAKLKQNGFLKISSRGSHEKWGNPETGVKLTIAGQDGDDAKAYIIKAVSRAIESTKS